MTITWKKEVTGVSTSGRFRVTGVYVSVSGRFRIEKRPATMGYRAKTYWDLYDRESFIRSFDTFADAKRRAETRVAA
jgi:hypothetical protein